MKFTKKHKICDFNRMLFSIYFVQVVELLLKNSADVTLTNLDGENALEIAIIHGKK